MKGRPQIPIFLLRQASPILGLLAAYNQLQWLLRVLNNSQWGLEFGAC